jgi:HipA-like protein
MTIDEVVLVCELNSSGAEIEVARVRRESGGYSLTYSEPWLNFEGSFGVSVLLPVRREPYFSEGKLFRVLLDRMPYKEAFQDLSNRWGVEKTDCPLVLLCTVGHRSPGSIVAYPADISEFPGVWSDTNGKGLELGACNVWVEI